MLTQLLPVHSLGDSYVILKELGDGSFGLVSLAKPRLHGAANVAIKTLKTREDNLFHYTYKRELEFLRAVPAHPHLIKVHEVFVDSDSLRCNIVMESMDMNLLEMIQATKEPYSLLSLRLMLCQIASGMAHIHNSGFYHRDIKPENVLVRNKGSDIVLKLADFGLARHCACPDNFTSYVSTRWYRAPELLLKFGSQSFGVDTWAFGVLAVELTNLKPLFPGDTEIDTFELQLEVLGSPRPCAYGGDWPGYHDYMDALGIVINHYDGLCSPMSMLLPVFNCYRSQRLASLINSCLKWDPKKRPSFYSILHHPFFTNSTVQSVLQNV